MTGLGDSNDTALGQDDPTHRNTRQRKKSSCGCRELQPQPGGAESCGAMGMGRYETRSPTLGEVGIMASSPEPCGFQREAMVLARVRWSWGPCLRSWGLVLAFKEEVLMPLFFPTEPPPSPCGVLLPSRGCLGSAPRGIIFHLGSSSLSKTSNEDLLKQSRRSPWTPRAVSKRAAPWLGHQYKPQTCFLGGSRSCPAPDPGAVSHRRSH